MLLIHLFVLGRHALSAPISSYSDQDSTTSLAANLTALNSDIAPSWFPSPTTRGTWDLLYSCLFTIGLCVWTAVHVNVPCPNLSHAEQTLRKLTVVLVGLLAPEAILYIAFRDLREAYSLKCYLNEEWNNVHIESQENNNRTQVHKRWPPWSRKTDVAAKQSKFDLTYGFYCVMGGFVIDISKLHNNRDQATLTTIAIRVLAREGKFLEINPQSINDKSKADFLAKGLVCLQISWVFLQCVARKAAGYPITLLELHTLVHIFCAVVIYGFWWQKPLNISDPTRANLWLKDQDLCFLLRSWGEILSSTWSTYCSLETTRYGPWEGHKRFLESELDLITTDRSSTTELNLSVTASFIDEEQQQTETLTSRVPQSEAIVSPRWSKNVAENERMSYKLGAGDPLPGYPMIRINPAAAQYFEKFQVNLSDKDIRRLANTESNKGSIMDGIKLYIGNFDYLDNVISLVMPPDGRPDYLNASEWVVRLSLIALCTTYGAVHMAAWDFVFPSATEKLLWRSSCLILLTTPSILIGAQFLTFSFNGYDAPRWREFVGDFICVGLLLTLYPAFLLSRLYFIVESLLSLRHVPIGVYDVVTWANYIPHL